MGYLKVHSDFTRIPLGIIQENNLGTFFVLLGLLGLCSEILLGTARNSLNMTVHTDSLDSIRTPSTPTRIPCGFLAVHADSSDSVQTRWGSVNYSMGPSIMHGIMYPGKHAMGPSIMHGQ